MITPSLKNGYAKNSHESDQPSSWGNIQMALEPTLGYQGDILYDISGKGNKGTLINGGWSTGQLGNDIDLPNTNDRIEVAHSSDITPTFLTVEAWVWLNSGATLNWNKIWNKPISNSSWNNPWNSVELGLNSTTGKPQFHIATGGAGSYARAISPDALSTNRWYYIVGTYDKKTVRVYVDGIEKSSTSKTGDIRIDNTTGVIFQRGDFGTGESWDGKIASLRIRNRALLPTEVLNNYKDRMAMFRVRKRVPYFVAVVGGGRIMSSLTGFGGLAGFGGIAGRGGGLAA